MSNVPTTPNRNNADGNTATWLLLALVVAAIGLVGWWAFFAPHVTRAPEVRVLGGREGALPIPTVASPGPGENGVRSPAPLAPLSKPAAPEGGAPH